jgi:DNA primase
MTFTDIVERLEQVTEHRGGEYISALCVWHDDHKPSMLVFADGWFRCLSCGRTGSHEQLWRKIQGWSVQSNLAPRTEWSPRFAGQVLDENFCTTAHDIMVNYEDSCGWYVKSRGVEGRIEPARLGWWNGWITIPIYNKAHCYQGVVLRSTTPVQKVTDLRYYIPPGQDPLMYCPDWRLLENAPNCVYLVFGMFDALALADLRFPVVTPTMGCLSFEPKWLDEYRTRIIIIPDKGEHQAAKRLAAGFGWRARILYLDYPDGCKDPADFLKFGKRDDLISQLTRANSL